MEASMANIWYIEAPTMTPDENDHSEKEIKMKCCETLIITMRTLMHAT